MEAVRERTATRTRSRAIEAPPIVMMKPPSVKSMPPAVQTMPPALATKTATATRQSASSYASEQTSLGNSGHESYSVRTDVCSSRHQEESCVVNEALFKVADFQKLTLEPCQELSANERQKWLNDEGTKSLPEYLANGSCLGKTLIPKQKPETVRHRPQWLRSLVGSKFKMRYLLDGERLEDPEAHELISGRQLNEDGEKADIEIYREAVGGGSTGQKLRMRYHEGLKVIHGTGNLRQQTFKAVEVNELAYFETKSGQMIRIKKVKLPDEVKRQSSKTVYGYKFNGHVFNEGRDLSTYLVQEKFEPPFYCLICSGNNTSESDFTKHQQKCYKFLQCKDAQTKSAYSNLDYKEIAQLAHGVREVLLAYVKNGSVELAYESLTGEQKFLVDEFCPELHPDRLERYVQNVVKPFIQQFKYRSNNASGASVYQIGLALENGLSLQQKIDNSKYVGSFTSGSTSRLSTHQQQLQKFTQGCNKPKTGPGFYQPLHVKMATSMTFQNKTFEAYKILSKIQPDKVEMLERACIMAQVLLSQESWNQDAIRVDAGMEMKDHSIVMPYVLGATILKDFWNGEQREPDFEYTLDRDSRKKVTENKESIDRFMNEMRPSMCMPLITEQQDPHHMATQTQRRAAAPTPQVSRRISAPTQRSYVPTITPAQRLAAVSAVTPAQNVSNVPRVREFDMTSDRRRIAHVPGASATSTRSAPSTRPAAPMRPSTSQPGTSSNVGRSILDDLLPP